MTSNPSLTHDRNYFSYSQLEAFQDCPRKWGWKVLDDVRAPPNPYAAFGTRVHAQLERYLLYGTRPDLRTEEGECATAGLHHLPAPCSEWMQVEFTFILEGLGGHRFLGLKDIQMVPPFRPPEVTDHKTTGNFKWAKTPEELKRGIQPVLYAAHAMAATGWDTCTLHWIYYKRNRPFRSHPVHVEIRKEETEPTLAVIKSLADQMAAIKKQRLRTLQLPPNPDACHKYGGCPYITHCNLTPQEKVFSFMSNVDPQKEKFMHDLAQRNNALPGAGLHVNPPAPVPPAPVQYQINETVLQQARYMHPNWNPGEPWWNGAGRYIQVGEPDYPQAYVPVPASGGSGGSALAQLTAPGLGTSQITPGLSALMPPGTPEVPATQEPRRRGRPPKAKATGEGEGDPLALLNEGLDRISDGVIIVKKAMKKLFSEEGEG